MSNSQSTASSSIHGYYRMYFQVILLIKYDWISLIYLSIRDISLIIIELASKIPSSSKQLGLSMVYLLSQSERINALD